MPAIPKPSQLPFSTVTTGVLLAILATIIWSGNFIVARYVANDIPPISLAFFRWLTGTLLLTPLAWNRVQQQKELIRMNIKHLAWTGLAGVTLFNTFIYMAGKTSPAVNMALIGTTSSPIMSNILAVIFLKEVLSWQRISGMVLCIVGILWLIAKGSWNNLMQFHFTEGDLLILASAFAFAVYNILVRKKSQSLHPLSFLWSVFAIGTLFLLPGWLIEQQLTPAIDWSWDKLAMIFYLGAGTSVAAFLCWNASIARLGPARTALFGNLIPIFSTLEAIWLLNESFQFIHFISFGLVLTGLVIANLKSTQK